MTTSYYQKNVTVIFFVLNTSGIRIDYKCEGKVFSLLASPAQAVELLKNVGFITSYNNHIDEIVVKWIPCDSEKEVCMLFQDFAICEKISQYWAIQIAIRHELDKADEKIKSLFKA